MLQLSLLVSLKSWTFSYSRSRNFCNWLATWSMNNSWHTDWASLSKSILALRLLFATVMIASPICIHGLVLSCKMHADTVSVSAQKLNASAKLALVTSSSTPFARFWVMMRLIMLSKWRAAWPQQSGCFLWLWILMLMELPIQKQIKHFYFR